jgi:hypothetical protein
LLQRIREVLGNADDRARDIGSMKPIAKPPTRVVANREVTEGLGRVNDVSSGRQALIDSAQRELDEAEAAWTREMERPLGATDSVEVKESAMKAARERRPRRGWTK